ncbi:hypothetical protein [Methanoregula sp.]|jgi:hypothetical protein|uniref:hypothetical protein n=1 Tax=Methanoregula sp. TaxID=2052170 RepID=UPI00260027B0|nr:hypothetical protein [Methanoregula sp.]
MTESVITEFTGSQRESISRIYRYSVSGVLVLDSHDVTRRLYRFDPSSNTMTENDPAQPGKILRRFVFDTYGMLEETFSFGQPPRTFRYEAGGRQIVMREGGDYGAVGKTFSFEGNGVAETAFGRDGSVERVYVFEPGGEAITIRSGGWYGDVERRLVCERINATVFREPEAFLQFLMFTEKSARETEAEIDEQVAKIRGGSASAPGQSRFAYTGPRHTADGSPVSPGMPAARAQGRPDMRSGGQRPAAHKDARDDTGIDFIADADSPRDVPQGPPGSRERSAGIPFEERWQSATDGREGLSAGRSTSIPLDERFRSSREEDRTLTKGRSASISLDERFQGSRDGDRTLTEGRSAQIPLEDRFQGAEDEKGELTPGRSTQISYEERKTGRRMR